ncbi:MAG: YbaB/EbfC family nucleoid-associated protein, partial [Christensenellales bacterium]
TAPRLLYTGHARERSTRDAYGSKVIKSIEIDPACVDPDDVEMLQDLVLSAVNEAMRMAEEATNSEVSKLTGGMGLGF